VEIADVALGEAGRGTAALLKFLVAGGGARVHLDVAYAELLNETERLLFGPGAYGQHSDDGAYTENDAQGGEKRTGFLGAQISESLANIGEIDHF
jgi:hypothetical protein